MSKKIAFTLAEVLLTMTLVGVVAAMTIPTLHYNKAKKEYTAKIKNFYSRMNNAVLDMELDKGSFRYMVKPVSNTQCVNWYMENIDPYYGHQYIENNSNIIFKDGSMLIIANGNGSCMDVYYDVNAFKGPNRWGYDRFTFLYCFDDVNRTTWFGNKDIFFGIYGANHTSTTTTRAQMISQCKSSPSYCTRLLQNDQWEFKDDYPFRF